MFRAFRRVYATKMEPLEETAREKSRFAVIVPVGKDNSLYFTMQTFVASGTTYLTFPKIYLYSTVENQVFDTIRREIESRGFTQDLEIGYIGALHHSATNINESWQVFLVKRLSCTELHQTIQEEKRGLKKIFLNDLVQLMNDGLVMDVNSLAALQMIMLKGLF